MSESKGNQNDSSKSTTFLQNPKLNNTLIRSSSMLRPSLFSSQLCFADTKDGKSSESDCEGSKSNVFSKQPADEYYEENTTDAAKKVEESDPLSVVTKNGLPKSNLLATTTTSMSLKSKSFVFGQNVHERVIGESIQNASAENSSTVVGLNPSCSTTSDLLFSSALQSSKADENEMSPKETDSKSLTEVAREYEESRAQKRKYDEVETFTGEEDEINVIDLNCKLFAFVNGNWEERGRGSLRLNDSKEEGGSARVVFRTSGNLRLLLNTKIWSGMVAQRPSQKSLRLTAMDNTGHIKIFLIMSRPDEINTIFNALTERINLQKSNAENDEDDKKNGSAINLKDIEDSGEPSPKKSIISNN